MTQGRVRRKIKIHNPSTQESKLRKVSMKVCSKERGCDGKIALGRNYAKKADELAIKHGKRFGVYRCPYCGKAHLTTKLEKAHEYRELLHVTPKQ